MTHATHHPPLDFASIEDALAAIRAAGLRVSSARLAILKVLFKADAPVSAQDFVGGERGGSRLDLASTYRNLEQLEELGIVRHVHLGHGPGLYALLRREREYLYCEGCGRVKAVPLKALDGVRGTIARQFGYRARFTHFPIVGLCTSCSRHPEGHRGRARRRGRRPVE